MFPNEQKYYRLKKKLVYSVAEEPLINILYTIPQHTGMH